MSTTNTSTAIEVELVQRRINPSDSSPEVSSNDEDSKGITLATFKDQQSNVLPHKKLMIVFPTIALAQMISYLDQTSVSTALPAIGSALNIGPSISWVATSFLLASTSVQLINGRLSDIFGRKPLLLICMGIMAIGNLGAGFATNAPMIFAFRTLSGLGGGAM
jgi:predicted MFS family arabinose efflux permease